MWFVKCRPAPLQATFYQQAPYHEHLWTEDQVEGWRYKTLNDAKRERDRLRARMPRQRFWISRLIPRTSSATSQGDK